MSKGGGGGDAMGYAQEALALQGRIHDENTARTQPFYDTGLKGFDMLANLIGIDPRTVETEEQIRDRLRDDYTTTTTTRTGTPEDLWKTSDGRTLDRLQAIREVRPMGGVGSLLEYSDADLNAMLGGAGITPLYDVTKESVTNTQGLDDAVQRIMAEQSQRPDNFGQLLTPFSEEQFREDPGYQFRLDQGQKALERGAAARGQYYDPSTMKALAEHNAGMADQTYNDAYNRYNNDQTNIFNRLATMSGYGQTANQQLNASGQNYANQAGNIYGNMANLSLAQGSQPSMFGQIAGLAGQMLGMFSDRRLKENIIPDGLENGHKMYVFNYKGDKKKYRGVMAQDIEKTHPEAISRTDDGLMMVDYSKLPVNMTEVI